MLSFFKDQVTPILRYQSTNQFVKGERKMELASIHQGLMA